MARGLAARFIEQRGDAAGQGILLRRRRPLAAATGGGICLPGCSDLHEIKSPKNALVCGMLWQAQSFGPKSAKKMLLFWVRNKQIEIRQAASAR
jgi:hypothetical protein